MGKEPHILLILDSLQFTSEYLFGCLVRFLFKLLGISYIASHVI